MKHIKNFLHQLVENIMAARMIQAERIVKHYNWMHR